MIFSKSRFVALAGVCAFALALATAACTVRPEEYDLDGQDVELVFLHTSDIHSRLLPYQMDVGLVDETLGLKQLNAPFGGMARLASVIKQEKRNHGRVAYMETGDVFQGAPIFNSFGGEPEFRAMTQLGVDAFAIGNHEFDNGTSYLVQKATKFAQFPMLAANYSLTDPDFTNHIDTGKISGPYTIINMQGIRVGVIGLGYVGGSPGRGGGAKGVVELNDRDVLQSYVDFIRPTVDLVAVASHAGYHDDVEIIPRTEGIDLYFGGHLHIALNPPNVIQDCDIVKLKRERDAFRCDTEEKLRKARDECETDNECSSKTGSQKSICIEGCKKISENNCKQEAETRRYKQRLAEVNEDIAFLEKRGCHPRDVLLVHSGAFLKYVGKLKVTLRQCHRLQEKNICLERDASNKCIKSVKRRCTGDRTAKNDWEVIANKYQLIPVDKNLPQDPQMLQLLNPFFLGLAQDQLLTQVLGYSAARVRRFSAGSGDSALGNMVCDAMLQRNQVWADFAVTNSLGIRSDIVAGPVDSEQMTNVFPFENSITVMYLSGYEVQEMMDFIAQRSASRGCQSQAQVSGVTATLNCKGCPGNGGNTCIRQSYDGKACAQYVTIGGSGRPCSEDKDCERYKGKLTGEICSSQSHPDKARYLNKKRCGMPISCTRSYRLATNDYVAHGGSGFTVLARNTTQKNLKIPLRDSAKDYIVAMPSCSQVPQTIEEKSSNKPVQVVLNDADRKELKALEGAALRGDINGANSKYAALVKRLEAEKSKAQTAVTSCTNCDSKKLIPLKNRWAAYINFLGCIQAKPDKDNSCLGLTCRQIRECTTYKSKDVKRCEALARIRSTLRCYTLPCIATFEDGRLKRVNNGLRTPDDQWPE